MAAKSADLAALTWDRIPLPFLASTLTLGSIPSLWVSISSLAKWP